VERPTWASETIDIERPSVARTYDHLLGGSHTFPVDREAARRVVPIMPEVPLLGGVGRPRG
jgi:hypothetical protein